MKCSECKFWNPKQDRLIGECRRNAPCPYTAVDAQHCNVVTYWPITTAECWCGEFEKAKDK